MKDQELKTKAKREMYGDLLFILQVSAIIVLLSIITIGTVYGQTTQVKSNNGDRTATKVALLTGDNWKPIAIRTAYFAIESNCTYRAFLFGLSAKVGNYENKIKIVLCEDGKIRAYKNFPRVESLSGDSVQICDLVNRVKK